MGTGSMQWTAAEMDGMRCNGLLWLCKFMVFSCWMQTYHAANPSALILSVKFCDQDTGTNLHTQERNERFSTLHLLASSVWRHLSCSPFCHVLSGAISLITRAGTCAHVHLFSEHRSKPRPKKQRGPKKHGVHIHITHPHHPPS